MKSCYEQTGGYYVMTDRFANPVFKESFKKFFELDQQGNLKMGFLGNIEIFLSKDIKVQGAIGHITSLKKKNASVAETELGYGQTTQWYIGGLDKNKSIAFYFDVTNTQNSQVAHPPLYLQF